ncbi:MAG: type II secretion system F family protein [Mariprofundaceae bacterium]|nr:type II secretion system F family protein [Mariprofundaceae bacterium]
MSQFSWEAVDANGRRRKGEIDAESERAARQKLKSQGLMVRRLQTLRSSKKSSETGKAGNGSLNNDETALFLQQLATLIAAGMPLVESLGSIATGMPRVKARRAITHVRQQLLEGTSLAEALRQIGLDDIVCNMVEAGEETGQLDIVASRLAELLDNRRGLEQELMSAILYPSIILTFGGLVMMVLLTYVVPQIVSVFQRSGGELPMITEWVIAASNFLRADGLWLLFGTVASIWMAKVLLLRPTVREKRDALLLRLPLLSSLLIRIDTARFSRTLGMLLSGGVPVLSAMRIAGQGMSLIPMKKLVTEASEALREGGSLAKTLQSGELIPHMAIQMMDVGEQSGELDRMLLRIADQYEQETSRLISRMMTIVEPALMLIMALLVGLLAAAILLPIVQMNALVH